MCSNLYDDGQMMLIEVLESLMKGGFGHIYFLNGHGANLLPIQTAINKVPTLTCRIRSWWEFEPVNHLRQKLYGDWEGMHATPKDRQTLIDTAVGALAIDYLEFLNS